LRDGRTDRQTDTNILNINDGVSIYICTCANPYYSAPEEHEFSIFISDCDIPGGGGGGGGDPEGTVGEEGEGGGGGGGNQMAKRISKTGTIR
jgi:hypothetical protein